MKRLDINNREEPIQRLQTEFSDNGHLYKLYVRNDVVAVYEQYDKTSGYLVGYELLEVMIRNEEVIKGVKYPKRETRPSTSMWGISAFTLRHNSEESYLDKRFKELTNEVKFRRDTKRG